MTSPTASLTYNDIASSYECYLKCSAETAFNCKGFFFVDEVNSCRIRGSNYEDPAVIVEDIGLYCDFQLKEISKL